MDRNSVIFVVLAATIVSYWYCTRETFTTNLWNQRDLFMARSTTQPNLFLLFSANGVDRNVPTEFVAASTFIMTNANVRALLHSKNGTHGWISENPGMITMGANQVYIITATGLGTTAALIAVSDNSGFTVNLPPEAAKGKIEAADIGVIQKILAASTDVVSTSSPLMTSIASVAPVWQLPDPRTFST
jgi:hypothetical protein